MAGEISIDRDDTWREPPETHASVLDRHVVLSASAGTLLAIAITLIAGTLVRFHGLDRWSLSAAEGATALAARDLLLGNDVPSNLLGRPFIVEWTALFMFLGDSVDAVARMSAAIAGLAAIVLVLLMRRWIGTVPSIASALLLAVSPTMIANSRRIDGGMLLVVLLLAFVGAALAARNRPSLIRSMALGVSAAGLALSGPLGLVTLLLAGVAVYLISRPTSPPNLDHMAIPAGSFLVSFAVLSTAFLTRPAGLIDTTAELFRQLFSDHLANFGDRFHVVFINLIVNEPLLLALGIIAVFAADPRGLTRALGLWTLIAFVVVSLIGDTGIAGHALVVLPLALLSGLGVAHLISRLPWHLVRRGPAAIYAGLLVLLLLAFVSVIGLLTPDAGLSGWTWIIQFLAIVIMVILPLAIAVSILARRVTGHQFVLTVGAALVLLSLLTVRSAVLASTERPGEPMDPLAQGTIAPSLLAAVERIERISTDLTRTERSPIDPTGGHGLRIAIDEQIEQPLLWYFRDYPNVTIIDPETDPLPGDVQAVFLAGDREAETVAPGLVSETYLLGHNSPELYSEPDWGRLLGGLFRIGEWRNFWGFMIERTAPDADDRVDFQLLVTPAIGDRLFGPSGPFALDDMAGAGVEGGQFSAPRGIAFAEDGSVYVVDAGNQRVQVFDGSGNYVTSFGEQGDGQGQFATFGSGPGGPGGIAVSGDRVYVADTWNHRVQVFNLNGEFIDSWGSFFDAQDDPEQAVAQPGDFYGPRGVAVHGERVYVTDTGNERVQIFDLDGEFIQLVGSRGSEPGQLLEPVGIAVTNEDIFVADSHNGRIARFSLDGEVLEPWGVTAWDGLRFFEPYLAATADGRIVATTSIENEILVFDADGHSSIVQDTDEVLQPYGVAIDPNTGAALITDGIRNAVIEVDIAPR